MKNGNIRPCENRKQLKIIRLLLEKATQHSIFDIKCQAHLLKVMNWCSDNFANFMADGRRVNKSFSKLFYDVPSHKC